MTVIAARKYKDKIWIAGDTQTSYGNLYKTNEVPENQMMAKIQQKGPITIGMSGQADICSLMSYYLRKKTFSLSDSIDEMMINEFLLVITEHMFKNIKNFVQQGVECSSL